MCFLGLLLCACMWRGCRSQAAITMSPTRGALHEVGAPLAPFRYITNRHDTRGVWLLKGSRPCSLMPGRTLATFNDERGVDADVYLACPGTDPFGILGYPGAVLPPHRGVQDAASQAPPLPPAAPQIRHGALRKEGDAGWPSLPPTVTAIPAATMVPTSACHRHRHAAVTLRRNAVKIGAPLAASAAALAAGFSGSRQGASGTPGAGGDASLCTLAAQAIRLPGAGPLADLMDADDAATKKARCWA